MNSIIYTFLMSVLWIANLFNGTGLGNAYHTTEYLKAAVFGLTVLSLFQCYKRNQALLFEKKIFNTFALLFVFFSAVSYLRGYGIASLNYLWAYLITYLVGQLAVSDKCMRLTSLCYGVLGMVILYIFDYGTLLSGWNPNTIGMIGLHSFLISIIPYYKSRKYSDKVTLIAITAIYVFLIYPTESRSSILFAIIGMLFAISRFPEKITISNKGMTLLWLFIPCIVSIIIVAISQTSLANQLNNWSLETFQKPIFNGRDELWENGFQLLANNVFVGTGRINVTNHHNSAVTCLVVYGIIGFILWIRGFYLILNQAKAWRYDFIVVGSAMAFLVLYVQQSVELGLMAENPNFLPYIMLGILLGRIKYLEGESVWKQ